MAGPSLPCIEMVQYRILWQTICFYKPKDFTVNSSDPVSDAANFHTNARWASWPRLLSTLILMAGDYIALTLAVMASLFIRNWLMGGTYDFDAFYKFGVIPFAYIAFIYAGKLYTRNMELPQVLSKLFFSCAWGTCFAIILIFFTHVAGSISRLFVGTFAVFSFFFLIIEKPLLGKILRHARFLQVPVLIVGAGKSADAAIHEMRHAPAFAYQPIGFLEDSDHPGSKYVGEIPILGGFDDLEKVVKKTGVQEILIAAPGLPQDQLSNMIYRAQSLVETVNVIPNLVGVPMSNAEVASFFDEKIMILRLKNNLALKSNQLIKRIFDVTLTIVGGICISPILLAVALWVYHDSPGPVIYKHRRVGRNGKEFDCYKFRSMVANSQEVLEHLLATDPKAKEEWDREFKLKNDPRITKSGEFLRKTSLDELPQLLNVLKGEMSLVGPRPIVKKEIEKYDIYIREYYSVLPGITGMWQCSGRSDIDYPERVRMDAWYVHNWSIWLDIVMIWRTFGAVLKQKGAY